MGDLDFGHWNFLGFLDTYLDSLDFLYILYINPTKCDQLL